MRRVIGAALAAIALAFAGSASAAVLYQESGSINYGEYFLSSATWNPLIAVAGGEVEIKVDFSTPQSSATPWLHYTIVRHHPGGNGWVEHDFGDDFFLPGDSYAAREWDAAATLGGLTLRMRNSGFQCQGWTPDSPACRYETPEALGFYPGHPMSGPVSYTVTISSIEGGTVPEPTTWAMMIIGFGAVGLAIRRQSPNRAQLVPRRRDL